MNAMTFNSENFTLLISGIADNDRFVKRLTGSDHPIYYKSRYTPPFEQFTELRSLILLVKDLDDINADNVVAIDLSEWVGHEQEEYFTVMLKFLHDQRDHWKYIFTVGSCSRREVTKLYIKMKSYLTGHIVEDRTFQECSGLEDYLVRGHHMQRSAASAFARLFLSRDLRAEKSYEIMEGILNELESFSRGRRIGMPALRDYLSSEDSLMCLLLGKTVDLTEGNYENIG